VAHLKSRVGPGHPNFVSELTLLALNLSKQKKWPEVEIILREVLTWARKHETDLWTMFSVQSALGEALLGQKKYAEARVELLAGYEGMLKREKQIPPQARERLSETVDRLVQVSEALDQPEEAKRWMAERAKYPYTLPVPTREP
jgi:hypothetical protein